MSPHDFSALDEFAAENKGAVPYDSRARSFARVAAGAPEAVRQTLLPRASTGPAGWCPDVKVGHLLDGTAAERSELIAVVAKRDESVSINAFWDAEQSLDVGLVAEVKGREPIAKARSPCREQQMLDRRVDRRTSIHGSRTA